MRKALAIIAACAEFAFRVPDKIRPADWLKRHVTIPPITGAMEPGPLDTERNPPMEGLLDLILQPHVHFFTMPKSGRVGGSLLCMCVVLHELGTNPGPILWVDPSRSSARQLFRRELEPFILACPPVAAQALLDKEHWTASLCFFKGGSFLRMAGAGSPNELAGYQARVVIINEGDKVHHTTKGEAPAHDLAIVRTKQFTASRKILENSTPTDEHGIWGRFLKGSQHHCYVPCPHCSETTPDFVPPETVEAGRSPWSYDPGLSGWQRLTFFPEEAEVPFSETLEPLPKGEVRLEKTGQFKFDHCRVVETREVEPGKFEPVPIGWDFEAVLRDTRYECAHCGKGIPQRELPWMVKRYRFIRHNPKAPRDHVSVHFWAAYCALGEKPDEIWGEIAKKFILAGHNPGALHDFFNNDLGKPFRLVPTEVEESDITRLQNASPAYMRRTIPHRPLFLSMTIDVQEQTGDNPFWWQVWAWGIHWEQPGWPTWAALVDYGSAVAWSELEEIAGLSPIAKRREEDPDRFHCYQWRDPKTEALEIFHVGFGLVDSGDQAQSDANVYQWVREKSGGIFSPSKGGGRNQLFGSTIRVSILEKDTPNEMQLVWYRSDFFAQKVYRQTIKDRKFARYLPRDLDSEFIAQTTDERTVWDKGKLVWKAMKKNNHLGDCWKMNEVLSGTIEEELDKLRVARIEAEAAEALAAQKDTSAKK
jgi:phage terminase large subunit GpA-like protein